jgi:putative phosphoribosyl transferase
MHSKREAAEPEFPMAWPVILLDGLPERRKACRTALELAGYQVLQALTVEDAIRLAGLPGREKPHAVIIEGSAGRELLLRFVRALRLHPATSAVPLLILSPEIDRELQQALRRAGEAAWLEEPFSVRRLLEEVQYVTTPERSGYRSAREARSTAPREPEPARKVAFARWWKDERMRATWGRAFTTGRKDAMDREKEGARRDETPAERRESGLPGGGAGRKDEVGGSGVYPASAGKVPEDAVIRTPAAWGQGARGAAGYEDSGESELFFYDAELRAAGVEPKGASQGEAEPAAGSQAEARGGPAGNPGNPLPVSREVEIPIDALVLHGTVTVPATATGIVLFAHGSGSSRFSPRNQAVARELRHAHLATLLFDLLSADEEAVDARTGHLRFDIDLLAERLAHVTEWVSRQPELRDLPIGYFGASTGAAAALVAAARLPDLVSAVVSRGGRPDLAAAVLPKVKAPTLLIVGGLDLPVIEMNREALDLLSVEKKLEIVPGASHLFEEHGKLEEVARLAKEWFTRFLVGRTAGVKHV